MKKHTSFKIGGPVDYFIIVNNIEELKKILNLVNNNGIPFFIIGNGSNLLVRDKGIRGIVAKINFNQITINKNENIVKVSSDYSVSKLARVCAKEGMGGIEFLAGIPGTVGGAIRMNAGAYGREMKDVVINTKCLTNIGDIKLLTNKEHYFNYRTSIFKDVDDIILETELKLYKDDENNINNIINEQMKKRLENQPLEFPSAGSTFKRNPNVITAKLIDECGLKGYKVGDAEVSTKHAGFIVNRGNATADDVLKLVEIVKEKVYQRFNEKIELEVIVVGEE
jgi:UDP-N-acetylmuramate dehydrogenase